MEETILPFLRYAEKQPTTVRNHRTSRCYDCRLFFFPGDRMQMTIDEEHYTFLPNTAVFLPPGTAYSFGVSAENRQQFYVLDFDLTMRFSDRPASLGTPLAQNYDPSRLQKTPSDLFSEPLVRPHCGALLPYLEEIRSLFSQGVPLCREQACSLLRYCLFSMQKESVEGTPHEITEKVLDFVERNYADASLTDSRIAQSLGYHPYYLSRVFCKSRSMTVRQYLIHYRLQAAKTKLLSSHDSVEDIAWQCGFNSSTYFIRMFKEAYGYTPARYRKEVLE